MAKYKNIEKDIDKEFEKNLLGLSDEEFTEYFQRLIKNYYDVYFKFDTDFKRYERNINKKYGFIRKVKGLVSDKYNNLDNYENLERLKITEEKAYEMMNELYFMEYNYKELIYINADLELNFFNKILSDMIEKFNEDPSETLFQILENTFKNILPLIEQINKLPVPEDEIKFPINKDIYIFDNTNYFSYLFRDELKKFDKILNDLKEILPEETIDEFESELNPSYNRLEDFNNMLDMGMTKEEAIECVTFREYLKEANEKKYQEKKYLYLLL